MPNPSPAGSHPAAPPLLIGLDAKWLDDGPPSGRVVWAGLLHGLRTIDTPHRFVVLRGRPGPTSLPPSGFEEVRSTAVPTNLLANLAAVPRVARRRRFDAMVYQSFAPAWGRPVRITRVEDVIDLDHPELFSRRERGYLSARRVLLPRSDWVVTVSEHERQRLVRHGLTTPTRCGVVHNGIGTRFKPLDRHDHDAVDRVRRTHDLPERFVLYVGRLNERKNLHRLLAAAAEAWAVTPQCPLVLVGAADHLPTPLPEVAADLGLDGAVRFLGPQPDADVNVLYALATLFVFVSLDEGFGLPPLEAMASGVPALVASAGAIPEVCGDAAAYVDPLDVPAIARRIDELLSDDAARAALRDAGLARAASFTWEASARALVAQIEAAVAARGRR